MKNVLVAGVGGGGSEDDPVLTITLEPEEIASDGDDAGKDGKGT